MAEGLKPCPFCGRVDKLKVWKTEQRWDYGVIHGVIENWRVVCNREGDETGCGGSGGVYRTRRKAIEAWNRRANDGE